MNDMEAENMAAANLQAARDLDDCEKLLSLRHHLMTKEGGQMPWLVMLQNLHHAGQCPRADPFHDFNAEQRQLIAKLAYAEGFRIRLQFNQVMVTEHDRASKADHIQPTEH